MESVADREPSRSFHGHIVSGGDLGFQGPAHSSAARWDAVMTRVNVVMAGECGVATAS